MARTWRDIDLPTLSETWRDLRGLRASPPSSAARNNDRRLTFQAALEQSQQFMEAATSAGPATRPVQLFYGLSQAGRAIAAASSRLPTAIPILNKQTGRTVDRHIDWSLSGHGIKVINNGASAIGDVEIRSEDRGTFPGVALALGTPNLKPGHRTLVRDLWAAIPETRTAPLSSGGQVPALFLHIPQSRRSLKGYGGTLSPVPETVYTQCHNNPAELEKYLDNYPSLTGWRQPVGTDSIDIQDGTYTIHLEWPGATPKDADEVKNLTVARTLRYRHSRDRWVFPALGGSVGPLHPLLTWWAVLYALSMKARYEPHQWAQMINIDESEDANAIEHLLDEALTVVPNLALEAIRQL